MAFEFCKYSSHPSAYTHERRAISESQERMNLKGAEPEAAEELGGRNSTWDISSFSTGVQSDMATQYDIRVAI
jgi:hypothetical protein